MEKVVRSLGLGIKGSARVLLHQGNYAAGDVVLGQVILKVIHPIECQGLSMQVDGTEAIAWSEGANHAPTNRSLRDAFLCEPIELEENVPSTFEPGEYRFRFRYQLDDALPSVFRMSNGFAGAMREVSAKVVYTIRARFSVLGKLSADIETAHNLVVHPPSLCHPVRSLEKSSSGEVRLLSLMKSKGACKVSVCMDSDVHISGSILSLQARVSNYSSRDMHAISVLLYEDLTVELPNRKPSKGVRVVCTQDFPGVAAGQLMDEVLHLPLIDDMNDRPVAPTNTAAFIRWKYRLEVKCRFTFSKSVKVDMPVIILRNVGALPVPIDGATEVPALVVVVPDERDENSEQQDEMMWSPNQGNAFEEDSITARPIFVLPHAVAAT
ncbi:hypothetical protein PHYBOEH_010891 [Phytophthora boehmeriae]|uniref:Arrestin C-terminal-like domain-containing protein n=1 Tax=Phytophthora boehmeriae TaxID=109152 RepID=A0A8T1WXE9_9STRA|nr:hypothetical protein PHYBOEH_010891 [Phytophthora boehmeriae]